MKQYVHYLKKTAFYAFTKQSILKVYRKVNENSKCFIAEATCII